MYPTLMRLRRKIARTRSLRPELTENQLEMAMEAPISPGTRYSRPARWFHWLVFLLVLLAYLFVNLSGFFERGSAGRTLSMQSHFLAGMAVLILVLPRLLHRIRNTPPPILPPLAGWENGLSAITHFLLYAFLVAQPLLGMLTVFYGGRGIGIPFTSLQIPSPMAVDHALHEKLGDIHGWIGTAFYYVIGLHIAGALWHHFRRKDNTLRRML
jgi:cytochrome b561